jgi:small subunit ribosomal protein S16
MLAIRMQRTGRKGHAMFRVVVQDSRTSPSSGKVVELVGNYDPHLKTAVITKERVQFFLDHGAHPSERVAKLLKDNDIKLPKWVEPPNKKNRPTRNPDKLAKAEPAEPAAKEDKADQPADKPATDSAPTDQPEVTEPEVGAEQTEPAVETPKEDETTQPSDEAPLKEDKADQPADKPAPKATK